MKSLPTVVEGPGGRRWKEQREEEGGPWQEVSLPGEGWGEEGWKLSGVGNFPLWGVLEKAGKRVICHETGPLQRWGPGEEKQSSILWRFGFQRAEDFCVKVVQNGVHTYVRSTI